MEKTRSGSKSWLPYIYIISAFLVYLGAYSVRELLGTVSPRLLELSVFDESTLGVFSSIMFASYGIGQFINGFLGEKLNVKLMISAGLISAALCTVGFAITDKLALRYVLWAICGYALSMIYAPLTRNISTYLSADLARIAYIFLTVGAILGATLSGFIVGLSDKWYVSFFITGAVLSVPLALFLVINARFERKAKQRRNGEGGEGSDADASVDKSDEMKKFSMRTFISCFGVTTVCFLVVNMLIKAARHAVSFWAPTYLASALGLDARFSAVIFGVTAAIKVVAPFFGVAVYKRIKENERVVIFGSMLISTLCFGLMLLIKQPAVQIGLFTVSLFFIECGGSIIGSVFLLSFKQFGCVSAICGFFDSTAYLTAAVCSVLFSGVLSAGGWTAVLCVWTALPAVAALIIAIVLNKNKFYVSPERRNKRKNKNNNCDLKEEAL